MELCLFPYQITYHCSFTTTFLHLISELQIRLLIQSCGPKVAEILSLLWAGLPHPTSNGHISLLAWQRLVLPFLHEVSSCPKQVLFHCFYYTALLLRWGRLTMCLVHIVHFYVCTSVQVPTIYFIYVRVEIFYLLNGLLVLCWPVCHSHTRHIQRDLQS